MRQKQCPGLPASWPNAWLAVLGATVLVPRMRLSWSEHAEPVAVLRHPEGDPADAIAAHWPDSGRIDALPLKRQQDELPRNKMGPSEKIVPARLFRHTLLNAPHDERDTHSLSSFWTDQSTHDDAGQQCCVKSPWFCLGAPRGETLHARLASTERHFQSSLAAKGTSLRDAVAAALDGFSLHVQCNGLGFDARRVVKNNKLADSDPWVCPIMEILSFWGLALLPLRGDGRHARDGRPHQKCQSSDRRLLYPAWRQEQPLDRWGIAALLMQWEYETSRRGLDQPPLSEAARRRLGVTAAWQVEVLRPEGGGSDSTRGLSSIRMDMAPQPTGRTERRRLATVERRASVL